MLQKLRNQIQFVKPSKITFYRLVPLILVACIVLLTVSIGIADPTTPPPPPPGVG
jgi:hypothetical protein